jgi:hypothetical protein
MYLSVDYIRHVHVIIICYKVNILQVLNIYIYMSFHIFDFITIDLTSNQRVYNFEWI